MKFKLSNLLTVIIALIVADAQASDTVRVSGLRTEYLVNPIGLDAVHPRLSWQLTDSQAAATQKAYRVIVGIDSAAVAQGNGDMWDTGKLSGDSILITYYGKQIKPFIKYYWRVSAWNASGAQALSRVASFETGMMSAGNWKGTWISDNKGIEVRPAPYFRKVFQTAKKIRSARAYIAVAGLYELYINGQKIGNHSLDPMYTRFDRRTLYVTHDVTTQLQTGKNAVGVLLGNGWYNHQSTAVWDFHKAPWRARPTFNMDIRVTYEDGSQETIVTDRSWKTSTGPLIFNSIYTAEHYDARLEQPGWNTVTFDESKWQPVINRSAPSANITAQVLQPIRNVKTIPAASIHKISDQAYVFNLGRNISGVTSFTVKGEAGTTIKLCHAERLHPNGRVDLSNIDLHYRPTDDTDPFQTDIYILSGKGEETFMPKFNYKGFQYVEVTSDKPIQLSKSSLTGYFMHSDVLPIGNINSSNPVINKIWEATNNSYLSNLFGYPTDCPQREKNGWTGDAHIAIETGLFGFEGITIYEKWLADHRDEQQPNGVLPSIIPTGGWGYEWGNGPDWTSTIAIIPWNLYLFYGDTKPLADNYASIKRYVDHIDDLYPTGLTSWGLGDWVPVKSVSPVELSSTAYYYTDVMILSKAAKLLGNTADYEKYSQLAVKIKNAFNAKYLNPETGVYGKGLQTELSVPLYWGLVPEELKSKLAGALAKRVEADQFHLDVGILGAKAILSALSENGYAEVAYKIAAQETYPSWGWWIVNGATTLLENWDIHAKNDISLNHIMFGEIGAWLYKGPGGIKPDETQPGFKNVLLQPSFVSGLKYFTASHNGPYGKIVSSWKRNGNQVIYEVEVPANSSATVKLEASAKSIKLNGKTISIPAAGYQIKAGQHRFVVKL